jgi:hypothetical protein
MNGTAAACILLCHTLGNRLFVGETQYETSFNVLGQFSPFAFPIYLSSFLCKLSKWSPQYSFIFPP